MCLVACSTCLTAWSALAQTGAQGWSQFQGGPGHPGSVGDGPAPPYALAWTFEAPEGALSAPVIAGNVAITVGEHAVYGVKLATGREAWQLVRNGGPISVPAVGLVGDRQILAFVDTAGTGKQQSTTLVRVDLGTMKELAPRTPLLATVHGGVAVDGENAYLGDDEGNVYAVDLSTGSLAWTKGYSGSEVLGTLAVSDGNVYAVERNTAQEVASLHALDTGNGAEVWPEPYQPKGTGVGMSAPAAANGTVVVGTSDRIVHAFSAADGTERWQTLVLSAFSPVSSPAFASSALLVSDYPGGLYRLDPTTGARLWDYQMNELIPRSSPVVSGGAALVGLNDGRLVAIDVDSGLLVWQGEASPGLVGAIALSEEMVVAVKGGMPGSIVAWKHDASGKLVSIPSPTVVDPATLLGNAALAAVGTFIVLLVPFRLLASRVGPAFGGEDDADTEEEEEGEDA